MPEYLAPGVYVEEVDRGPKSIEGVSTSTAAFLGQTERGPTTPRFVSSFADFKRTYGGFAQYADGKPLAGTYLAYAVDGFFTNGGSRAYIGRIEADETPTATAQLRAAEPKPLTPRVDFGSATGSAEEHLLLTNEFKTTIKLLEGGIKVGPDSPFESGNPSKLILAQDETAEIPVTYTSPDQVDQHVGTLTIPYVYVDPDDESDVQHEFEVPLFANNYPSLTTDTNQVTFGSVPLGTSRTERVTLKNEIQKPIELGALTSEDTLNVTVGASEIAPGDETLLALEYTPSNIGPADYTVDIPFELEGSSGSVEVSVTGNGAQPLEPSVDVVDFGILNIETGDQAKREIELSNLTTQDLDVEIPQPSQGDKVELSADANPLPVKAGKSASITVKLNDDDGLTDVTVDIPNPLDDQTPLSIRVVGIQNEVWQGGPAVLNFGDVPLTTPSEPSLVQLTYLGEDEVKVTPNTTTNGTSVEEFVVDPTDDQTLNTDDPLTLAVTYAPSDEDPRTGTLELNDENDTIFSIPLSGTWKHPFETATAVPFGALEAVGPGVWGSHIHASTAEGSLKQPGLFKLTLRYWTDPAEVRFVQDNGVDHEDAPDPDVEEIYDNLSLVERSSDYFVKRVNAASVLVDATRFGDNTAGGWNLDPVWLTGEFDSPYKQVTVEDYNGVETPGERTGFAALKEIRDISIVCVPDEATERAELQGLTDAVVTHCESLKDRFAVVQAAQGQRETTSIEPTRGNARLDSSYCAFYYPWLEVRDPETQLPKLVPPGGHMAGIYARSDGQRGVHKAPANESLRGIFDVELQVTKEDQDVLNPKGVNCIRNLPGRGIRVWGARTTATDPSWKYVNVRRLFLYLEQSIDEATQWVVFEPNDEGLWARVRQTVNNFLTTVWRNGALMGTTAEEAFYVRCDRTTMTQDDIDNGRLIVEIGVAPVKPAEFVIFRISQWTEGAAGA